MTVGLGDGDFESPIVTEHIAIIDQAIADKAKLDDDVRKYFQDPLNKYKAQYREIDERIRERKRRCDEMDKLKDEVKRYTEKKDVRLATVCHYQYCLCSHERLRNVATMLSDRTKT